MEEQEAVSEQTVASRTNFIDQAICFDRELDPSLLGQAYDFAAKVHSEQQRASGEPFLTHPVAVSLAVAKLHQGSEAVAAALLHDCVEDAGVDLETLVDQFGPSVATLVSGLTKLSTLELPHREARQAEYLRRLLMTVAEDVRVIVIKLTDRLHNMETLSFLSSGKRHHVAAETLEIYAPLAHRLGMDWFRIRLEDLAFKELDSSSYQHIKELVSARKEEREAAVKELTGPLHEALTSEHLKTSVTGRAKHFYAIYRKLHKSNRSFNDIWDLLGLRVLTSSVADCYKALGIVHTLWPPIEGRFKDYIARPKSNMYRSLHTTVMAPDRQVVELQIRTEEMHSIAEYGVAAHWRYHSGNTGGHYRLAEHLSWFQKLIKTGEKSDDPQELLELFRQGHLNTEVMVLTPKGQLLPMRAGATALDFAFSLHTEVGLHCTGARINGKAVPLGQPLRSGDRIEIATSPTARPTQDWLARVATNRSKQKIRRYLRQEERERQQARGRSGILKILRRLRLSLPRTESDWGKLAKTVGLPTQGELLLAVGAGKISSNQLAASLTKSGPTEETSLLNTDEIISRTRGTTRGILLGGLGGIAVQYAGCCNPIPGDKIVALVTRGRGASIHMSECRNALLGDPKRWFEVDWDVAEGERFLARLTLFTSKRRGLLGDIEPSIQAAGSELKSMDVQSGSDYNELRIEVTVANISNLEEVKRTLRDIPGVRSVSRGRVGTNTL